MNKITYKPIGIIHSPFENAEGMPTQPTGAKGVKGFSKIKREYVDGLQDIGGFSHVVLLYHFHLSKDYSLKVKPFLDGRCTVSEPSGQLGARMYAINRESRPALASRDSDFLVAGARTFDFAKLYRVWEMAF